MAFDWPLWALHMTSTCAAAPFGRRVVRAIATFDLAIQP